MAVRGLETLKYHHVPIEKDKSFFFDSVHIFWHEQVSFHQHVEWELSYIITGSGTRVVGDVAETFSRGEIVLIPPNMPHCWSFDALDHDKEGKIRNMTICFPGALILKFADNFPELKSTISRMFDYSEAVRFEGPTLKELQTTFEHMPTQNGIDQLASVLRLFSIIGASDEAKIVGHTKHQNRSSEKMREIHRFILNRYHQNITLDDVANHVKMNRSSLCVFFKRVQGKSLISYLNEFRVESSCQMLRETNTPVADICHAVGFNDVPYYNRLFRRLKKVAPSVYRSNNQRQL